MTEKEFIESTAMTKPSTDLPLALQALWWDLRDAWEQAHSLAQDDGSTAGSWVHAYLHRKEGDQFNAGYWYSRAGKPQCDLSLEDERQEIIRELLNAYT